MILFARGGVYTDIDTVGLKPVDEWISNSEMILEKKNRSGLVVGIEAIQIVQIGPIGTLEEYNFVNGLYN